MTHLKLKDTTHLCFLSCKQKYKLWPRLICQVLNSLFPFHVYIQHANLLYHRIVWICVCVCVCPHARACTRAQPCLILWPHGLQLASLLCPWDLPSRNTGVGCHFLSRGCSQPREDQTHISCISCIGRLIIYHCTTGKPRTVPQVHFLS